MSGAPAALATASGTFRVCVEGPQGAPWLVFSNSLGTPLELWDAQAAHFAARGWRVLRYDPRGHGGSAAPAEPCTLAQLGGDVLALLDALGIDRAAFCGISMGGLTGLWLALHAPGRLTRLVVANSAARIGTAAAWQERAATVRAGGAEAMAALSASAPARWFTPAFVAAQPAQVRRAQGWIAATPPAGYAACCDALAAADLRGGITAIGLPTLLVAGAADPVTTVADAQFLRAGIAGARMATLPASHLSALELPQAFHAAVGAFLEG